MHDDIERAFALVGPGRAGTTVAVALVAQGWNAVAVAGRDPGAPSVRRASERLGAPAVPIADAGRRAGVVLVAAPDSAIADAAAALAPGLRVGALVLHLSGACTLAELDKLRVTRPDVRVGSLHPLQSLPSVDVGVERLAGSWCAVDGPSEVEAIATSLGMRPFRVDDARRVTYHAAATVASNHLVALLAQAQRLADAAGVPRDALLPLVRATVDNVAALGAGPALTGPVARGDVGTVVRHLDAMPPEERSAYRELAEHARRLAGRDDPGLRAVLEGAS